MQQWRMESRSMTFDEVSMERSKSFVKALQELKNLRPQLYSAAEYCEKSYLQSEQKQMVLDNLKSYAVRAVVNAVDHLGTVAYKLTELFEQQKLDVSLVESKISCLNQQCCTCQAFGNKQGLSQLNMTARTLRHHKHYTLPDFLSKYEQSSPLVPSNGSMNPLQAKSHPHASGKSASKTLSWHLAVEANSGPSRASIKSPRDVQSSKVNPEVFHLLVAEKPASPLPPSSHRQEVSENATSDRNKFALMGIADAPKPVSGLKSLDSPARLEIYRPSARSKNMFSALFTKGKNFKQRKVSSLLIGSLMPKAHSPGCPFSAYSES